MKNEVEISSHSRKNKKGFNLSKHSFKIANSNLKEFWLSKILLIKIDKISIFYNNTVVFACYR